MDDTASEISFNDKGICNYCSEFKERLLKFIPADPELISEKRKELLLKIKKSSRGKKYGCIVGVSGGADSSWSLYQAVKEGLNPLAVHMDNGWDSELAANNIEKLVKKLDVDLHTHVIDWDEYRDLMQSFFDADVIDVELLYDNAMLAVNYQQASKYGLHYILSGSNLNTEGMVLPKNWNWFKWDKKNIYSIQRKFGHSHAPKTLPSVGFKDFIYFLYIKRIKWISFLDYLSYNKIDAMRTLETEFGFKPYPYKHYESVFTRFYQGYILPHKFNVDKRKMHLSSLIISGYMKREEALDILRNIPYPSKKDIESDIEYFLKKMRWSRKQFDEYIGRPEKSHLLYGSEEFCWTLSSKINAIRRKFMK
jgi:N-acetyl sugar amidotransferase